MIGGKLKKRGSVNIYELIKTNMTNHVAQRIGSFRCAKCLLPVVQCGERGNWHKGAMRK